MAHVQYTNATVLSELCRAKNYQSAPLIQETVDAVCEALYSPYNSDDYRRERKQHTSKGIVSFLNYAYANMNSPYFSDTDRSKINQLLNCIAFKKVTI